VLARHGIPAVVCMVTGQLSGDNAWEGAHRSTALPLLAADQLHTLSQTGWEIAAHSHQHAHLTTLRAADLAAEMSSPRADLVATGLPEPRIVAYPYGEHDLRVRRFARRAGYCAGLAMQSLGRRSGAAGDRFALPRLEVHSDTDAEQLLALITEPEAPARPKPGLAWAVVAVRLALDGLDRPRKWPAAPHVGAARSTDDVGGRSA